MPHVGPTTARGNAESSQSHQPLDSHSIAFITCVNDETQYLICLRYLDALRIPSGYAVEKIAVLGATSMAEGYQRAMETSTARYKVYLHQDGYLVHRKLLEELLRIFGTYPRLGMFGMVGATRLPASGMWWEKNRLYRYGRFVDFLRPPQGFPASLMRPPNLRRLQVIRLRSFVGDYLPAAVVDGLFMATQYDFPWTDPLGGFELYDQVHSLEFIKAGLEVGIARQEAMWCIHWGPLQERVAPRGLRRQTAVDRRAATFRQLYPLFLGVPARKLYQQHRGAAGRLGPLAGEFGDGITGWIPTPADFRTSDLSGERLGVVIVALSGRELPLRALKTLLPQIRALKEVEYRVVVVGNALPDSAREAVRRQFPTVAVLANASNDGPAHRFNLGLRYLGFPSYVLVMHHDVEVSPGTLATMVGYLREHRSTAGVVACRTNPDGTPQVQRMAIVELVPRRPRRPQRSTFVGTTCVLMRGDVFFDVGLYDEGFRISSEDLDWSLRAKRKGYRFISLPDARVIHHHDMRERPDGPGILAERFVANLRILYKHGGPRWAAAVYWAQRLRVRWVAFRWRNDSEALYQLNEAMVRMDNSYRRFREENRLPQLL